jgi:hypothetical protein
MPNINTGGSIGTIQNRVALHCGRTVAGAVAVGSCSYLGLRNTKTLKELWMLDGELDHLLDLLDLLVQTTDHFVGAVGHLFDSHQADKRVDFVGQDLVQYVRVIAKCYPNAGADLCAVNILVQVYNVLAFGMHLVNENQSINQSINQSNHHNNSSNANANTNAQQQCIGRMVTNLYQNLVVAHVFDHITNIRARLLQ